MNYPVVIPNTTGARLITWFVDDDEEDPVDAVVFRDEIIVAWLVARPTENCIPICCGGAPPVAREGYRAFVRADGRVEAPWKIFMDVADYKFAIRDALGRHREGMPTHDDIYYFGFGS